MASAACPRCSEPLKAALETKQGLECSRCGGLFASHNAVLEFLTGKQPVPAATIQAWAHPYRFSKAPYQPANPLADPIRYVPCPTCRVLMNRKNFGGRSGVIVDVCHRHGVWFDAGELTKVVEFVAAKGLPENTRAELLSPAFTFQTRQPTEAEVMPQTGITASDVVEFVWFLLDLLKGIGRH